MTATIHEVPSLKNKRTSEEQLVSHLSHPTLRRTVKRHQDTANHMTIQAASYAGQQWEQSQVGKAVDTLGKAAYAQAVADYTDYLTGGEPSEPLKKLLDL